jgi:hypothetical protein
VPGTVTRRGIHADFGQLGDVSFRFLPSGQVLQSATEGGGCSLHAKARLGTFVGTFRFRGEGGYTAVTLHRIRGGFGAPTAPINRREVGLGCPHDDRTYIVPFGQLQQRTAEVFTIQTVGKGVGIGAIAVGQNEATVFKVWSASLPHSHEEGAKSDLCILLATIEETQGRVAIARTVIQFNSGGQCQFNESNGTFSVAPQPPFTGTAVFQRSATGSTSWLGSLSVPTLGHGPVALAGPSFTAKLWKR